QIARQPAGYFVADLQSSNGVTVNGGRLTAPTQIFAGDVIGLGDALLRCEQVPAPHSADETPTFKRPTAAPAPTTPNGEAAPISQPAEAPTLHLRIAPQWRTSRASRPRLAPPRLAPTPRRDEPPAGD
ncbi:MAG TPA: FHA domain-containing protein, partial [Ktedonobacterales bacterium]